MNVRIHKLGVSQTTICGVEPRSRYFGQPNVAVDWNKVSCPKCLRIKKQWDERNTKLNEFITSLTVEQQTKLGEFLCCQVDELPTELENLHSVIRDTVKK